MPVPARDEAPLLVREAPQPSYEPPPPPQIVYMPQPSAPPVEAPPPPRVDASPALVVDMASPPPPAAATAPGETGAAGPAEGPVASTGRTRAATFANPSTTVPQGTLIHAVLETGFDSTRPGFARALVQRDVRGFDGSRVLIPRGSRLIGEYSGAAVQGQKRALILWSRLIRPDGITISIGSPATDTVGRGGVRARVDSHFLERFGGALLQSVLDIGVNLAARSSDSPVIIAVPGAAHGAASLIKPAEIPPTLKVAPGTSISVFVARDLDFTGAEAQR
jgi:type IV secretion system protein VirB10